MRQHKGTCRSCTIRAGTRMLFKHVLWCPRNISDSVGWPNASTTTYRARGSELHAIFPGFAYTQRIFELRKFCGFEKFSWQRQVEVLYVHDRIFDRVRIKSYVLKLSTEQHIRARNFGQTCRNAKCQVVRSRRAPEILTKITVREVRASYSRNERNQSNVEARL